jgi:dethiobiotin synthetase
MAVIFITGIDTGIGKTYATGLLARYVHRMGKSVITQKIIQTGCSRSSDDISVHRIIMGIPPVPDDEAGTTCPYLFTLPASPHLAAKLQDTLIDPDVISRATDDLAKKYEYVLVEGVGGICVPLNDDTTLLDYLHQRRYPLVIVSSSRLGSINHSLMTLELAKSRNLEVAGIVYNRHPEEIKEISEDTKKTLMRFLAGFGYPPVVMDMPAFDPYAAPDIDFSELFVTLRPPNGRD